MNGQSVARGRPGCLIRVGFLVAAAGIAGLFVVARRLEPDPRGFGTHTQLGLPRCTFLTVTGRLCPTCGMTTSFAWLVRGRIDRSWQANPAGCLYALLAIPLFARLVCSAVVNQPVGLRGRPVPLAGLVFAMVALGLASWLIRLLVSPSALLEPAAGLSALSRGAGL